MRKHFKFLPIAFLAILFSFVNTAVNAQSDFANDVDTLIEACKTDFAGLKGDLLTSTDVADVYECTYQIKGYSTTYLAINKGTNYTYVFAALPTTGSEADAACDRIARDFVSIPDCKLYDSRNDPNSDEDRRLQGTVTSDAGIIYINAVLKLSGNSEIIVSIQKPSN